MVVYDYISLSNVHVEIETCSRVWLQCPVKHTGRDTETCCSTWLRSPGRDTVVYGCSALSNKQVQIVRHVVVHGCVPLVGIQWCMAALPCQTYT